MLRFSASWDGRTADLSRWSSAGGLNARSDASVGLVLFECFTAPFVCIGPLAAEVDELVGDAVVDCATRFGALGVLSRPFWPPGSSSGRTLLGGLTLPPVGWDAICG